MTTVVQAYEAILQFARGHTGLECEITSAHLVKSGSSNDIYFRVECAPEVIRAKHPMRLVMDTVRVIVSGVIRRKRLDDEPPGREDAPLSEFNALELAELNGTALAQCVFEWTTPQGAGGALSRLFGFRNGYIHEIN